jgi:hypothetical protein
VKRRHLLIPLGQAAVADDSIYALYTLSFAHLEYNSQVRHSFPRGHKRPVMEFSIGR